MSYEIIYDKQFVKLADNLYIPFIYWGSNNCFSIETDSRGRTYQKRERNWRSAHFITKGEPYLSGEKIIANIQGIIDEDVKRNEGKNKSYSDDPSQGQYTKEEILKNYGWFSSIAISGKGTSGTSAAQFMGIFKSGIKNARTIEELAEHNISLEIYTYCYDEKDFIKEHGKKPLPRVAIHSVEQFFKALKERAEYNGEKIQDSYTLKGSEWRFKRMRDQYNPKKRAKYELINVDHFYTIAWKGCYLNKYTRRGFTYSHYAGHGKNYATEKAAQQYLDKIVRERRHKSSEMRLERIDEQNILKMTTSEAQKYLASHPQATRRSA